MRVLVNNRCIRARTLRLRNSFRSVNGHWFHVHSYSLRPNYEFQPLKFQYNVQSM